MKSVTINGSLMVQGFMRTIYNFRGPTRIIGWEPLTMDLGLKWWMSMWSCLILASLSSKFNKNHWLMLIQGKSVMLSTCTRGPCYMWSFYLRIRIYAIEKRPFFWNLASNLHWLLVFLYVNSLYVSIFLESLSIEPPVYESFNFSDLNFKHIHRN